MGRVSWFSSLEKKEPELHTLPSSALTLHCGRAEYVLKLLYSVHNPTPPIMSCVEYGWEHKDGQLALQ